MTLIYPLAVRYAGEQVKIYDNTASELIFLNNAINLYRGECLTFFYNDHFWLFFYSDLQIALHGKKPSSLFSQIWWASKYCIQRASCHSQSFFSNKQLIILFAFAIVAVVPLSNCFVNSRTIGSSDLRLCLVSAES